MKYICMEGYDDTTYISEKDWGHPFTPDEIFTIKRLRNYLRKYQPVVQSQYYGWMNIQKKVTYLLKVLQE